MLAMIFHVKEGHYHAAKFVSDIEVIPEGMNGRRIPDLRYDTSYLKRMDRFCDGLSVIESIKAEGGSVFNGIAARFNKRRAADQEQQ